MVLTSPALIFFERNELSFGECMNLLGRKMTALWSVICPLVIRALMVVEKRRYGENFYLPHRSR